MGYTQKIRILEEKVKQLEKSDDKKDLEKMASIINELRRLRRAQWEEEHERVHMDDER